MEALNRREFLGTVGASAAAPGSVMRQTSESRPNILFVCSDNHNPDVVGCAGHRMVRTPNIDRLAREGTYFTNAYCGAPVCVPARSSLMSGRFASDVDSWCNATPFRGQVPTWGHHLRDAGYYTMATGKMDMIAEVDLGFHQVGTTHEHETFPNVAALFRRPLCYRVDYRKDIDGRVMTKEHWDAGFLRTALEFLREDAPRRTQPWALYVGFMGPIPGFQVEPKYFELYPPSEVEVPAVSIEHLENLPEPWQAMRAFKQIAVPIPAERVRRALSAYYGNVTALDDRLGQILNELDRSGLRRNTLVVYTCDHGRCLGEQGMWLHNDATDHSSRITTILAGPGIPAGRRIATPVMHVDLFPTLLEFGGAPIPPGLRGHSLAPLWQGHTDAHPGIAYSECHAEGMCTGSFVIRKGKWKYIHFTYYDSLLFDMEQDPREMHNLIGTPEGRSVSKELHAILCSLVDPVGRTERAFARQEQLLRDLCARMSLEELLQFGFEARLGRGQAITLLKKYKR